MNRPPLFLDLDGPLLDVSARYHGVYSLIAEELGVEPLARQVYWQAKRRQAALEEFFPGATRGSSLKKRYLDRWLACIEAPEWLALDSPVLGAEECLQGLAQSYSLYLVTLRRDPAALAAQLEDLDLWPHFRGVYCGWAEGTAGARVKADWMQPLVKSPHQTAMVGDSEIDILAARLLNIHAIGVSYGIREGPQLQALGATVVLDRLSELPRVLGDSGVSKSGTPGAAPTLSVRVQAVGS